MGNPIQGNPMCKSNMPLLYFLHSWSSCHKAFLFPSQTDQPSAECHCLAPELLENLKVQLEELDVDICATLQAMKNLRLVNRHWSSWATGATTMLRIMEHHVLFTELVEMLAEIFISLSIFVSIRNGYDHS